MLTYRWFPRFGAGQGSYQLRPILFKRHRFPPDIIRYGIWLYFRFTLSLRDVEVRWTRLVGQFGGLDKLGSGCRQAANLSVSVAPYASSGVRPASVEWGRWAL
jgi:hypothetical protein